MATRPSGPPVDTASRDSGHSLKTTLHSERSVRTDNEAVRELLKAVLLPLAVNGAHSHSMTQAQDLVNFFFLQNCGFFSPFLSHQYTDQQ